MQVNKINNISFGKIILDCNNPIPASWLFGAKDVLDKNRPNNNYNPHNFMNDNLIAKVIASDYNTPKLKARNVMDFLEDACKYANMLRDNHLISGAVEKTPIKNTLAIKLLKFLKLKIHKVGF